MTKTDIIEGVYEQLGGFSKKEAAEYVETTFDLVKDALKRGDKVKVTGFGTFTVRAKRKRKGRNPKTGEAMDITARKVCTFKPSNVVKSLHRS